MVMVCGIPSQSTASSAEEQPRTYSPAVELFGSPIELTSEAETSILNWLECEECRPAQLKSVVQLGPGIIPFLALALEQGPSRAKSADLVRFLETRHTALQNYQNSHPHTSFLLNKEDYVQVHLSNLVTQYQIHAATALGAIGGPLAKQVLRQALDRKQPEVVRLAVQDALKPRIK